MALLHTRLPHPLDVFAHALFLEHGTVGALHFGLFKDGEVDLAVAQDRAFRRISSQMPPPPARLLCLGAGSGIVPASLFRAGYEVTALTADRAHARFLETALPTGVRLHEGDLESIAVPNSRSPRDPRRQPFRGILVHDVAHLFSHDHLLQGARAALEPRGRLVILDVLPMAVARNAKSIAEEHGFELLENLNLSKAATPTLEILMGLIRKHEKTLRISLRATEETIRSTLTDLETRRLGLAEKSMAYALLTMNRTDPKSPQVRSRP